MTKLLYLCIGFFTVGTVYAQLYTEDFSRPTDPGTLSPWIAQSGTWAITGGSLSAGPDAGNSFSFLYITNSWSDYSVQARLRFSSINADGGGLGGRLDPYSGGHYAAWISPEGASNPSTLQLTKFQYWYGYEYTNTTWQVLQRVSLPTVGTNWHTLKLTFQGNQISVYYDSNLVARATDIESNPFLAGGIVAGVSTANATYKMFMDDILVTSEPTVLMALNNSYSVSQNGSLTVPAPGILSRDSPGSGTNLSALRLGNTSRGALTMNADGGFTYVPSNNFVGIDSFTYRVSDGVNTSGWATVALDVLPSTNIFFDNFTRSGTSNSFSPWVTGLGEWTVTNGTLVGTGTVTDNYCDTYVPGVWGDFSIQTRFQLPAGAWACGISGRLNPITGERYVVNVYPEGSLYPSGPTPAMRLIKFHSWGTWSSTFTAMAQVALSSVGTSYHTLKMVFYGNTIDVYYDGTRMIHTVDNNVDGIPFYRSGAFGAHLYMYTPSIATFDDYNVNLLGGINYPPVLPAQADRMMGPLATLMVTNSATDPDAPANVLSYTLTKAPPGATIDTNGIISWTPTLAQDVSTNLFTTIVTDFNPGATNSQHLSATNSFNVVVNSRPILAIDSTALTAEGCLPANGAIDSGENVTLLFSLKNTGLNDSTNLVATLLPVGGVANPSPAQSYGVVSAGGPAVTQAFSFSASAPCGATLNATLQLQDGATSLGTISVPLVLGQIGTVFSQSFDSVTAPALPAGWTSSSSGAQSAWITQTGTSDTPPNVAFSPAPGSVGVNQLVSPPIQLPNGPCQLTFSHRYDLETNNMSSTEGFDGGVLEIKIGSSSFTDILAAGGAFITNGYTLPLSTNWGNPLGGRMAWSGTTAGYIPTIVNLPATAGGQLVQFQWRCGTDNGNSRTGWRVDSVAVLGRTCCTNGANNPPILTVPSNQTMNELSALSVSASATDPDVPTNTLTFSVVSGPIGLAINTNSGAITWTPSESQGPSTNVVTIRVTDNGSPNLSDTESFTITVNEVNSAPVLTVPVSQTINELATLNVSSSATDSDLPPNTLTFSLIAAPGGLTINTNTGAISWTPTEAQGPSTNTVIVRVTDNGLPNLSDTESFTVVVNEVNTAPTLTVPSNQTINELTTLSVNASATDPDIPANTLTFSLVTAPAGMVLNTNTGAISWTPTEAQGPSTNTVTIRVTDNGSPNLTDTKSFTVAVNEVNTAPVLTVPANQTINELVLLTVEVSATDSDIPTNTLVFSLLDSPSGMIINPTNGTIVWTPTETQGPGTNLVTVKVTDNGSPNLSDTKTFTVVVDEVNTAPVLNVPNDQTINELTLLSLSVNATDSDLPTNTLTFSLVEGPSGMTLNTNNGALTWTPTEAQGPSTNTVTVSVTDNGTPNLSDTKSFTVVVLEVNSTPVLTVPSDLTINELSTLSVAASATDSDIPTNTLRFALVAAPAGMTINTNSGTISWTPAEIQGPSTNTVTVSVTDNGTPNLSDTKSFSVVVLEVNSAPVLTVPADQTINELTTINVSATATDSDIPANVLVFSLISSPAGMTINTNTGEIAWTPGEAQGPSTNTVTVMVSDNGTPVLNETNSFTIVVNEVNQAPVLQPQPDRTLEWNDTFTVTNSATDADLPLNPLTYSLEAAPSGAMIDDNGVITWTVQFTNAPSTNVFTTIVNDFNFWAVNEQHLSATNSFVVVVSAPAPPPFIQSIEIANDAAILTWTSTSNHIYRVQYKGDLSSSNWTDFPTDLRAIDSICTFTNTLDSADQRFYRVFQVQ